MKALAAGESGAAATMGWPSSPPERTRVSMGTAPRNGMKIGGLALLYVLPILGATAVRMQRWLRVMSHPDGEISLFNDAALGVAPNALALSRYAAELGLPAHDRLGVILGGDRTGLERFVVPAGVFSAALTVSWFAGRVNSSSVGAISTR